MISRIAGHRHTEQFAVPLVGWVLAGFFLAACSSGMPPSGPTPPVGSSTQSTLGYSSTTFVVPFDVTPPAWQDPKPTDEQPNFVTWAAPGAPAVRFLVPVSVYPAGSNRTADTPEDYLTYLLSQSHHGAHFTDQTETTVGDQPATLLTATSDDSLDGSLGCPAADTAAPDCFGLQPDLALRIAVLQVRENTLLIWLRTDQGLNETDKKNKIQSFEDMLHSVRFSDRSVQSPATSSSPTNPISQNPGSPRPLFVVVARYSAKSLGLNQPSSLAVGPDGNAYITDASQRVSVVSPNGKVLRRWGQHGSAPGKFSFISNGNPGVVAAIAVAQGGNVYVADSGNNRIEVFSPQGKFLRQFGKSGLGDGEFRLPFAIAVDSKEAAYIADDERQTVSKFSSQGAFEWSRGGSTETDPDLMGHFHFASVDSHNALVMANDDVGRVVYLDSEGQKSGVFGSANDFPEGPCDVTVDHAGTTFVAGCSSPETLRAFDQSHNLLGAWSPSGLASAPRFGSQNQIIVLGDGGSVLSLRPAK